MPERRKLLIAYLATPGGDDALELGVKLARAFSADLDICMVLPPLGPAEQAAAPGNTDFAELLDDQAVTWLEEATARVPDDIDAEGRIAFHDNAAEGLVSEAQSTGCAAIIVGGTGGGLIGRHSLGSVVNDLLHMSPTPVVISPRGIRADGPPVRRITCAVGRRPGAEPLLRAALDACRRTGLPLRLVSLVTGDDHISPWRQDQKDQAARDTASAYLAEVVERAHGELGNDYPITSSVNAAKSTEEAIASLDWDDSDIVYVGSSRLAQPFHLFLGATAARMLRVLSVPMVVVPKDA